MKEIDFLPSWYKQSRRKKAGYQWQYAIIILGFVFMVCWSFFTGSISETTNADLVEDTGVENLSFEINNCQKEITELHKKETLIKKCKSKIVVSNVIAEISAIVNSSVILSSIEITAKEYMPQMKTKTGTVIRSKRRKKKFDKDFIYRITITGLAVDNNSVAELICGLESSQYFDNVITGYSKEVKKKNKMMSKFEISFNLANFKEIKK